MSWLLLILPLHALATDPGVIIFGGEGPAGPVDTVSVLTKDGWCSPENVLLPPLPQAASGLTAYHGYETAYRPFVVVCGFPGGTACYFTTLSNPIWTPVGLYQEDIDMTDLEFITMYDNYMGGGLASMWRNKTSGMYDFLWAPGAASEDGEMVGWLRHGTQPSISGDALGSDPRSSCVAQPLFNDGYPYMTTFSGGFDTDHSLGQLIILDAHYDEDDRFNEWKNNSIGIGEPRSDHSCSRIKLLGTGGLLVVGGFSKDTGSDSPSTLSSMEFLFPDPGAHSDIANTFQGFQPMNQPRSGFGLSDWGDDGLVAVGGRFHDNSVGPYKLLDSVEIWDKEEDIWTVRDDWSMELPRAGFGIVSREYYGQVIVGSDYCSP